MFLTNIGVNNSLEYVVRANMIYHIDEFYFVLSYYHNIEFSTPVILCCFQIYDTNQIFHCIMRNIHSIGINILTFTKASCPTVQHTDVAPGT